MRISIFAITSTLQRRRRLHTHTLASLVFHDSVNHSTTSLYQFPNYFSSAFHRTSSLQSQTPFHFSLFRPFTTQSLHDPFDLFDGTIRSCGSLNLGFIKSLKRAANSATEEEAVASLDDLGVQANRDVVCSAIWELKDEWRVALLSYRWGEKWGCVDERACELMVWVLGNCRKFGTAWTLIRDLHRSSMSIRRAMLIMIDRYAAANDPEKSIWTFKLTDKFQTIPDQEAYYFLLKALCKHGNLEEAEEFMLANKKLFPLETDAFNIILNGWCNIYVDILEAKRIWREMSNYCITPNASSYTNMISGFSRTGNLFDTLRLYDEMKKRGWTPGLDVYNSLIYVLTCENCVSQALKVVDKIKEAALRPNSVTYNSLIGPLCEAKRLEEARNVLAKMLQDKIQPTLETYHAFLAVASFDGTLEVLDQMKSAGLSPRDTTFDLILSKFIKLKQLEDALRTWDAMKLYEGFPSRTHYTLLIEGLVSYGMLSKAWSYYAEMIENGFLGDPKLQKRLNEQGKKRNDNDKGKVMANQTRKDSHVRQSKGKKTGSSLRCRSKKKMAVHK